MGPRTSLCLIALAGFGCRETGTRVTDSTVSDTTQPTADSGETPPKTTDTGPVGDPCDPAAGMEVSAATVTQPWNANEALVDVRLSAAASLAVSCTLDTDSTEVHLVESGREADRHTLRVSGLRAGVDYSCVAAAVCPSSPEGPSSFSLSTRELSEDNDRLPGFVLQKTSPEAGKDYVAVNHQRSDVFNGQRMMVVDRAGHIRWHVVPAGGSNVLYEPESSGFVVAGGYPANANHRPRLLRLFGGEVEYDTATHLPDVDDSLFHHDGRRLADGRYLTLEERLFDNDLGIEVIGFGSRIVDPKSGTVDFDYSSASAYDDGHITAGPGNTYHANWVDMYDVGGQDVIHYSLCGRSWTVAVDVPSGDWRWAFGAGGSFTLVDDAGKLLPDSEYPQCQHGLQRVDNRLLVYDNGKERGFSRVVEYELDEKTMTATLLWEWTEADWFERNLGNVAWTPTGRVIVGMGHREPISPIKGDHSTIVEIDPVTGSKLWDLRFSDSYDQFYRANPIAPCDLFANAKYCSDTAARLAELSDLLTP